MATIPGGLSLGLRSPQARGSIVSDQSGQIEARGLAQAGKELQHVSDVAFQQQDRFELAKAKSALLSAEVSTQNSFQNDPDWKTFEPRYRSGMSAALKKASALIQSPVERQLFEAEAQQDIERGAQQVRQLAVQRQVDSGRADLADLLDTNRTQALNAVDEQTQQSLVGNTLDAITAAASPTFSRPALISEQQAQEMRRKWTESFAEGLVGTRPHSVQVQMLEAGGGVTDFIPPDKKAAMLETAKNQELLDLQRQRTLHEQALKDLRDKQASDLVGKMYGPNADLTYGDILTSDLSASQKMTLINALKAEQKEPNLATFNALFEQVADGSISAGDLVDKALPFIGHGLTPQNYAYLRNFANDIAKDGPVPQLQKDFLSMAKSQITNSTMFAHDPGGDLKYYQFLVAFQKKLAQEKAAGKSLTDLLDPTSKDYLGPLVKQYIRSPQQVMQDMINSLAPQNAAQNQPARQPGESPADYLKRIQNGK